MNELVSAADTCATLVRIEGLTKSFPGFAGDIPVLNGLTLTMNKGDLVSIMGPSGAGKSTLLFIMALLLAPDSGRYEMLGRDVLRLPRKAQAEFRRKRIGLVFQSCDLLDNSTVFENLEIPLIYGGVGKKEREKRIAGALDLVNMNDHILQKSSVLSGGERQRVAIARALVNQPDLILADEPTGQIDQANSQRIMDYFISIVDNNKTSMLVVTHDPDIAKRCRRTHLFENGRLNQVKI